VCQVLGTIIQSFVAMDSALRWPLPISKSMLGSDTPFMIGALSGIHVPINSGVSTTTIDANTVWTRPSNTFRIAMWSPGWNLSYSFEFSAMAIGALCLL
jgi:hypothetical protein